VFDEPARARSTGESKPLSAATFRGRFGRLWLKLCAPRQRLFKQSNSTQSDVEPARIEALDDAHWELTESASRYRQLLDVQHEFVVHRSGDGRLVFANAAFCDAFGVRREEVLGTNFKPERVGPALADNSSGEQDHVEQLVTRKGKRWISWHHAKLKAGAGESEVQSVGRDVTVERAAGERLKEALETANSASRAKSRFLAAMSHEFRTPMSGILGMISLMRDTPLNEQQQAYVRAIEDSARALLGLIDNILDFSKIEAGKLEIVRKPFSLRNCVERAAQILEPQIAAKALSFTVDVADDLPHLVHGDELRVRQILLNLLSNAVKFTERGGVKLSVRKAPHDAVKSGWVRIAIEIADTGIGFPPGMAKRLFQEFEQEAQTANRKTASTGLGLAISRRLARAMGGDIVARGAPYRGATFTTVLRFEIVDSAAGAPGSQPQTRLPAIQQQATEGSRAATALNVLVVEDDKVGALLASKVIERAGGIATVVQDGRSAIAAIWNAIERRKPIFDLVLMDILMPGIDGVTAARVIKSLYAERGHLGLTPPPIIALTAKAFQEDRERCRAAGMDDYLAKPFDADELEALLLRWTAQRRDMPAA
jgi:PAS domain S-box-containing protein